MLAAILRGAAVEIKLNLPEETEEDLRKLDLYVEQLNAVLDLIEERHLWPGAIDREAILADVPKRLAARRRKVCIKPVPKPAP